jgi:hypothetical protein
MDKEIEQYVGRYINFINENDIKLFFEMDIDPIVGLPEVERYRKMIETNTGKKSIPVWHKARGKQYFLDLAAEYDYIAVGGIVTREISITDHALFPWFINEAHKRNCKIHGLGYTNLEGIKKYAFDSVDSTSWKSGRRFGSVYRFSGGTMKMFRNKNCRIPDYRSADLHNLHEWIHLQKYMTTFKCKGGFNL